MTLVAAAAVTIPITVAVPIVARVFGRTFLAAVEIGPDIDGSPADNLGSQAPRSAQIEPAGPNQKKPDQRQGHEYQPLQLVKSAKIRPQQDAGGQNSPEDCKNQTCHTVMVPQVSGKKVTHV